MTEDAIAVFTARSAHRILREGGSQAWTLDPVRARKCTYLICTQNQHNPDRDFSDATAPHGAAFLIGKISDVVPAKGAGDEGRWMILINEFCVHTVMNAWKGERNPVRYTTLEEMGVKLNELKFHPLQDELKKDLDHTAEVRARSIVHVVKDNASDAAPLNIASAKAGLAAFYGVAPEAIEIVIRG